MNGNDEPGLRAQMHKLIPQAFAKSIRAYDDAIEGRIIEEKKDAFAVDQKNAQLALKNMEALFKLGVAAGIFAEKDEGHDLAELIRQANSEIEKYRMECTGGNNE